MFTQIKYTLKTGVLHVYPADLAETDVYHPPRADNNHACCIMCCLHVIYRNPVESPHKQTFTVSCRNTVCNTMKPAVFLSMFIYWDCETISRKACHHACDSRA